MLDGRMNLTIFLVTKSWACEGGGVVQGMLCKWMNFTAHFTPDQCRDVKMKKLTKKHYFSKWSRSFHESNKNVFSELIAKTGESFKGIIEKKLSWRAFSASFRKSFRSFSQSIKSVAVCANKSKRKRRKIRKTIYCYQPLVIIFLFFWINLKNMFKSESENLIDVIVNTKWITKIWSRNV